MYLKWGLSLLPLSIALLMAGDQPWKDKQVAQWNDDDARQVLKDSPWVKTVKPTIVRAANNGQRQPGARSGGGMGRTGGGIGGIGGISVGLPGTRQRGGWGRTGGGYPGGGYPGGGGDPTGAPRGGNNGGTGAGSIEPPTLTLRWESALPVREAELKTRDVSAPTLDSDHYAIAVYGVPNRIANGDAKTLANELKKQADIKRDGKKDLKPSSVEVLQREDGVVVVYLFPRSKEITQSDRRVEFDAQIGRLQFEQLFYVDDMTYQGRLEL